MWNSISLQCCVVLTWLQARDKSQSRLWKRGTTELDDQPFLLRLVPWPSSSNSLSSPEAGAEAPSSLFKHKP